MVLKNILNTQAFANNELTGESSQITGTATHQFIVSLLKYLFSEVN